MPLTIILTKADYFALYKQIINKRIFWLSAAPLLLAIPLSASILIYTGIKNHAPLVLMLLPFAVVVALASWIFYRAGRAPAVAQYRDAHAQFGAKFEFEFLPDTLRCHAGEQQYNVSYCALAHAVETKKHIFLFVSQSEAFVFPKAALSGSALDLLHEKMALAGTAPFIADDAEA